MGLADALFAGLGQGLNQGATNYVDGLQRQQQMDIQKQQAANQQVEAQRQATDFTQKQAGLGLAGAQQGLLAAYQNKDYAGAAQYANQVPGLYQKANNITGVDLPAPIVGMPVQAQPATPMGPADTPQGLAMGAPAVAAHTDWGNDQTLAAIRAHSMIQPQTIDYKNGDMKQMFDPFTRTGTTIGSNQLHLTPEQQLLVDAQKNANHVDVANINGDSRADVADINKRYISTPGGLYDTQTGVTIPNTQRTQGTKAESPASYKNWDGFTRIQAAPQINSLIENEAAANGIRPSLLKALIYQESSFNPKATSPVGAMGLGQLMPDTAKGLGITNPYDPAQGVHGAALYLAQQLKSFGGDESKALAAYNAGPGAVQKYGGIPPFAETKDYVSKISQYANRFDNQPQPKPVKQSAAMSLLGGAATGAPANDAATQALQAAAASIQARQAAAAAAAKAAQQ